MWFKVDDDFWAHPKVLGLSTRAVGLWTLAGSWSGHYNTDGHVPKMLLRRLGATVKTATELVSAGLWVEADGGGWHFHDWQEYNDPGGRKSRSGTARGDAARANHERWHVRAEKFSRSCSFCVEEGSEENTSVQVLGSVDSQVVETEQISGVDPKRIPKRSQTDPKTIPNGSLNGSQNDPKMIPPYPYPNPTIPNGIVGGALSALPPQNVAPVKSSKSSLPSLKRGTRIPEDFALTAEMREWAAERTPLVDVDVATERFVNYWRAKTGNATKLDWPATWKNWVLKDQQDRRSGQRLTPMERAKQTMALPVGDSFEEIYNMDYLDVAMQRNGLAEQR